MARNSVIEIDYSKIFEQMLVDSDIRRFQIEAIRKQLGGFDQIDFPHKGIVSFEVHDFSFSEPTTPRSAGEYIRHHDPDLKWKPFDIEHLLHYYSLDPNQDIFKRGFVFATRRFPTVQGEPCVFILHNDAGSPDLDLVKNDHPWSAYTSTFPGQRKLPKK
jgi:hypothetical protein